MDARPGPAFEDAWVAALDELELDCARAEELLRSGALPAPAHAPWAPPALAGPLPGTLADRARALLDRQLRTAAALTAAMHATGRQAAVAGRFAGGSTSGGPTYVDRSC